MRKVGSRELKNRLDEYLRLVKQGELLLNTERNRPVARLVSAAPAVRETASVEKSLERLEKLGWVRLASKLLRQIRPIRVKGKPASRIILEDRE